jgi:putative MFS transporter
VVSAACFFQSYDLYILALALKQIQASLAIPEAQLGFLGSWVRFGALPAFGVAVIADRLGRRRVFLFSIIATALLAGATAFTRGAGAFAAVQFLLHTFAVAQSFLAVVIITEELDAEVRGWGIGALFAIQACGAGLAALMFTLVEVLPLGWRSLYLLGLLPLLLIPRWRRMLPETTRFEAQRDAREATTGYALSPVTDLFRVYRGRLLAAGAAFFVISLADSPAGFFGPKYLQDAHGWTPGGVGGMTLAAGGLAIVGNTFAGWLSDRIGRKGVTIGFLCAGAFLTVGFYNAAGPLLVLLWTGMMFALMGGGVTIAAYGAELFPTSYRSTATGARMVVMTIGASIGLALESVLYGALASHWLAISALAACALLAPLIVAIGFPETAGRALEEISPEAS